MDASILFGLVIALAVSSNTNSLPVLGAVHHENIHLKCNDVLDHVHASFPDEMALEDRCKRYAVVSSLLSAKGRPQHMARAIICQMSGEEIDRMYLALEADDELPRLFMTAIDGYRASKLGPAFLELIECLKPINRPYIGTYLHNPELVLVVDLYKRVLQSPEMKLDLGNMQLEHFSHAFLRRLGYLFENNLHESAARPMRDNDSSRNGKLRQRVFPWGRRDPEELSTRHHHREQERLRNYRLKLLDPTIREKAREQQRQRRLKDSLQRDRNMQCRQSLRENDRFHPYETKSESRAKLDQQSQEQADQVMPQIDRQGSTSYNQTEVGRTSESILSPSISNVRTSNIEPSESSSQTDYKHQLKQTLSDPNAQSQPIWKAGSLLSPAEQSTLTESRIISGQEFLGARASYGARMGFEYQVRDHSIGGATSQFDTYALPTLCQFDDTDSVLKFLFEGQLGGNIET